MAEDHVANAEKARDVLIRQRRVLVEILSRGYNGSEVEGNVELLVKFQAAIDVLDEVIDDEHHNRQVAP